MFLMSTRACIICCAELINGYHTGQKTPATLLAKKFSINIRTLNPSLNKMTRAGILKSQVGGADRGYIFARDPKDISLYEVVEAIQGFDYMRDCKEVTQATCSLDSCANCPFYHASKQITDYSRELLKEISITDLFKGDKHSELLAALS